MADFINQIIFGLAIGSIYSLVAIGFTVIFRATGLLHFAHPDLMMVGGLIGYTLAVRTQMPLLIIFLVSGIGVALLSAIIDLIYLRPVRRKGADMLNLIIATIGWSIILVNVAFFLWEADPLSYPDAYLPRGTSYGGIVTVPQNLLVVAVGILSMVILQFFFYRSRTGHALRATAENPTAAQLMGIRVDRMMTLSFLLSGFLAGGAGVLIASILYASPDLGLIGIKSFAAAVLGGFGQIGGAMVGGLMLGIIETMGAFYISSAFKDIIAYSLLILILLVRPTGLFGSALTRPD